MSFKAWASSAAVVTGKYPSEPSGRIAPLLCAMQTPVAAEADDVDRKAELLEGRQVLAGQEAAGVVLAAVERVVDEDDRAVAAVRVGIVRADAVLEAVDLG